MGRHKKNLTGTRCGNLTVLGEDNSRIQYVVCQCDCGKLCSVHRSRILKRKKRSCGCMERVSTEAAHQKLRELSDQYGTVPSKIMGGLQKNNKSGVRGVWYSENRNRYYAYISLGRKHYNLGTYMSLDDAADARRAAEDAMYKPVIEAYQNRNHT